MGKIKIGILGTAQIARQIFYAAKFCRQITVAAVASRDSERAKTYAQLHHIPKWYGNYEDLILDPNIDLIYNPLPNGLHKEWSIRALKAGKPVLCEKPIASNTQDAIEMKKVAYQTGLLLAEGYHNLYHPTTQRIKTICDSHQLGTIQRMEHYFILKNVSKTNIRYQFGLAGGSLMDLGCYGVSTFRYLCHEEPVVISATAKSADQQIDDEIEAELKFPSSNIIGKIKCTFIGDHYEQRIKIIGTEGELEMVNCVTPFFWQRIVIKKGTSIKKINVIANLTYVHQMRAVLSALQTKQPILTSIDEGIKNMQVIDAIYRKAGLPLRESTR